MTWYIVISLFFLAVPVLASMYVQHLHENSERYHHSVQGTVLGIPIYLVWIAFILGRCSVSW